MSNKEKQQYAKDNNLNNVQISRLENFSDEFKKDKEIIYSKNFKGWNNRPNRRKANLKSKIRYIKEQS